MQTLIVGLLAGQISDLGERLARLESQIMLIHSILEELVRPIREQREAEAVKNQTWVSLSGFPYSVEEAARIKADLFAPRGTQWDKSAGLDQAEIDDLDVPFPIHPKDDEEGPYG